jgi:hypothetical protein
MNTTTFAILNSDLTMIERVVTMRNIPQDNSPEAREFGRRFVWLPLGGEIGQRVSVDEDGEAVVI